MINRLQNFIKKIVIQIHLYFAGRSRLMKWFREVKVEADLILLARSFKKCGARLFVDFPITIHNADKIEIGDDVGLGAYMLIWGGGGIKIGNRVMIATHSVLSSQSHYSSAEHARYTKLDRPIVIEDDAWLGAGCLIMPGVTIGRGAIIGAGAVVTHDVPAGWVYAGVPARPVHEKNPGAAS